MQYAIRGIPADKASERARAEQDRVNEAGLH